MLLTLLSILCLILVGAAKISLDEIKQFSESRAEARSGLCTEDFSKNLWNKGEYRPVYPSHPKLGECRAKDFRLLRVIGSGAHSTVYRAKHKPTKKTVTLKVLRQRKDLIAIRAEECLQHRVRLSSIRKHYCTYVHKGTVVLVMEHIKGVTLQEYSSFNSPIPDNLLKKWAAQLSVALMALHLNSVVMMDMAPKNLLVTKNRLNIKIIDFGLARDPTIYRFGRVDSYAGTPYFASPENAHQYLVFSQKSKFAKQSSDWYALGVILHLISTTKELYNYPFIQELSNQKHALAMQVLFGNISRGFKIDENDRLGREDLMDFIESITKVDAELRLGTTPETFEKILDSPLFADFGTLKDFINRKTRPLI